MGSRAVVRPRALAAGSRVALVAPAGPLTERDDLTRACELCGALDWTPVPGPRALSRYGYLAGHDEERLADLNEALRDPSVDAVWCIRGGFGSTRILERVEFGALADRPRPLIGFSDITALLLAALAETGVIPFHGPMARAPLTSFSRDHLLRAVSEPVVAGPLGRVPAPAGVLVPRTPRIVAIREGVAEGPLVGGNLTMLSCLAGTRYFPAMDGAILFLEDVGEDLYRVDRMLAHLRMLGALRRLSGVIVGQFTEMKRGTGDGALGFDEVLSTYLAPLGIPAAYGFPIGHVDDQWTLPLGVRARLDAGAGEVTLLEPAVA